jgi:hypothetical protein
MKHFSVIYIVLITIFSILIASCASSTGSRYSTEQVKSNSDSLSNFSKENKEDFDISPYKTKIQISSDDSKDANNKNGIWFNYAETTTEKNIKTLNGTKDGYRVLVITTDNIEEANQIKADVYFSKNADEVYVDFEPPFYKVKVGDFSDKKTAEDLRFKLNQLGYKESKVVKETINIYK